MHRIVYLHGLASSSLSSTPKHLQKLYPEFEVIPLELYHQCHRSLDIINTYLRTHEVDAVMGTSLGGFFALACDFEGIKIVVNPALHPENDLNNPSMMGTRPYLQQRLNPEEKTYTMTKADLDEYHNVPLHLTQKTFIIQSSHDETLGDYTAEAVQLLAEIHDYVADDGELVPDHVFYHTITDKIGHRLTKEFLEDSWFYNLLSAAFCEPIYPLVNGQPHPNTLSNSPF